MEKKTFSCYDNFVSSNSVGAPTHDPGVTALSHLAALIPQAIRKAQTLLTSTKDEELPADQSCEENHIGDSSQSSSSNNPHEWDSSDAQYCGTNFPKTSDKWLKKEFGQTDFDEITLIGFSKGCVVLNQIITELHATMTVELLQSKLPVGFVNKVRGYDLVTSVLRHLIGKDI